MLIGAAAPALGQCDPRGLPVLPMAGVASLAKASTLWTPKGTDPNSRILVVGGSLVVAGDQIVHNIATYDPSTAKWGTLGDGTNGAIDCLAVLPNGDLLAGGEFTRAGGVQANHIARWDGSAWSALGAGTDDAVYALAIGTDGSVYAGGNFTHAGVTPASYVARWDGATWSAMGTGTSATVRAMLPLADGSVVVGGDFATAGGINTRTVARWDGSAWRAFGSGLGKSVYALARSSSGDLIAGGSFQVGGMPIAKWDGSAWSALGTGFSGNCQSLLVGANGAIISGTQRWNGSSWSQLDPNASFGPVYSNCQLPDGSVVACGNGGPNSSFGPGVYHLGAGGWEELTDGADGVFLTCAPVGRGFVVGGYLSRVGPLKVRGIAQRREGKWFDIGGSGAISVLFKRRNGNLVAVNPTKALEWDGTTWTTLTNFIPTVYAVTETESGDLIFAGSFTIVNGVAALNIARWDGAAWHALGDGLNGEVDAVIVAGDGSVVAAGTFTKSGSTAVKGLARWNGSSWQPVDPSVPSLVGARALAFLPNGDLVVGGGFALSLPGGDATANIARWDGSRWWKMKVEQNDFAVTIPYAMVVRADGTLVAGISAPLDDGSHSNHIASWDGSSWHPLGAGVDKDIKSMCLLENGDVLAVGLFRIADNHSSPAIAIFTSRSPADFNNDGFLDIFDFSDFVSCFADGNCPPGTTADFNGDGTADMFDFTAFVARFEAGC